MCNYVTKPLLHSFQLICSSNLLTNLSPAFQMKIWDNSNDWFPTVCKAAKTFNSSLSYCQLMGDYVLELNDYNTIELYPKMNENCESNPYYNYTRCPLPETKTDCRC